MTDQPANPGEQGEEQQLFKTMDEQERIYAPEEVPGGVQVPQEMDEGGTAASGTAAASHGEFFEESESTEESERREGG